MERTDRHVDGAWNSEFESTPNILICKDTRDVRKGEEGYSSSKNVSSLLSLSFHNYSLIVRPYSSSICTILISTLSTCGYQVNSGCQ